MLPTYFDIVRDCLRDGPLSDLLLPTWVRLVNRLFERIWYRLRIPIVTGRWGERYRRMRWMRGSEAFLALVSLHDMARRWRWREEDWSGRRFESCMASNETPVSRPFFRSEGHLVFKSAGKVVSRSEANIGLQSLTHHFSPILENWTPRLMSSLREAERVSRKRPWYLLVIQFRMFAAVWLWADISNLTLRLSLSRGVCDNNS